MRLPAFVYFLQKYLLIRTFADELFNVRLDMYFGQSWKNTLELFVMRYSSIIIIDEHKLQETVF